MLHILFIILKILGILLLVILGLLFLCLMAVLFVPIRYRGNGSYHSIKDFGVHLHIHWLLHAVSLWIAYENGLRYAVKLFGFRIFGSESEEKDTESGRGEGAEIIQDNVQDTIFGGFAPNSQTAEVLSKALGNRTVMSGSVNRGKNDTGQSLQMISRPLMTPDELKSIPKGEFVVMKTGTHPMRTRLRLFLEWGITFGEPYQVPERSDRRVDCAGKKHLVR